MLMAFTSYGGKDDCLNLPYILVVEAKICYDEEIVGSMRQSVSYGTLPPRQESGNGGKESCRAPHNVSKSSLCWDTCDKAKDQLKLSKCMPA